MQNIIEAMLAFKNIRAILPTRLHSRLFIIRQISAFCLILKNGDLAEHLIGPAAKALQLRPSACTKGCGLFSSKPSVRFLSEKTSSEKKAEVSSVFQELFESWLSLGESLVTRTSFQSCQSFLSLLGTIHFSELAITATFYSLLEAVSVI